jgi:hypothetical protein
VKAHDDSFAPVTYGVSLVWALKSRREMRSEISTTRTKADVLPMDEGATVEYPWTVSVDGTEQGTVFKTPHV